ncbi:UNVERIFIED_CONTAM: hypothetical protein K2H54_012402 [Gekko kuhli]
MCWLLPFVWALFLGPSTWGQGTKQFTSPPGPLRFLNKKEAQELWQKHQTAMIKQVNTANELALKYWNQKYNTTFFRAPGQLTHILMETVSGRIYHVTSNLVQVECPEDKTVNIQNCAIVSGTPKLVCKLSVIIFFQHDKAYISEEGCQEAQPPTTSPEHPEMVDEAPYVKEEGPVYI